MSPKVLIVDDANFTRDLIRKAVRSRFPHFQMEEAANGKQAQGKLERGQYDLVLCDWEMPEMTGDELLTWIRQNEATRELPFIMITSRGDKENVVEAIKLGVSNYVAKPFTTDKLVDAIFKVLKKRLPASALVPPQGSRTKPMGNESANVLLGAQQSKGLGLSGEVPIAAHVDKAGPAPGQPTGSVKVAKKLLAQLRFGSAVARCLVREIALDEVTVVLKRDSEIPAILDLAVFDFDNVDGSGASRINGFIHRLEARDPSHESEFINVTLRFVDDDEEKRRHISDYMEAAAS